MDQKLNRKAFINQDIGSIGLKVCLAAEYLGMKLVFFYFVDKFSKDVFETSRRKDVVNIN